jgi:hypothetical protein
LISSINNSFSALSASGVRLAAAADFLLLFVGMIVDFILVKTIVNNAVVKKQEAFQTP